MENLEQFVDRDISRKIDSKFDFTVSDVIEKLMEKASKCYISGGAPRDWLMGLSSKDIDISVNINIEEIEEILLSLFPQDMTWKRDAFGSFHIEGDLETVDINILRTVKDIKQTLDDSVFRAVDSIAEDYTFRDFSINTFYYDCATRNFENPCPDGFKDVKERLLRIIMDADKLAVDYVVCIRILQFMARDFAASDEVLELLQTRLDQDCMNEGFEQWLNIYINAQLHYYQSFKTLVYQNLKTAAAKLKFDDMFARLEKLT